MRAAYIWRLEREVRRKLELEAECSASVWTIGLGGIGVKRRYESRRKGLTAPFTVQFQTNKLSSSGSTDMPYPNRLINSVIARASVQYVHQRASR